MMRVFNHGLLLVMAGAAVVFPALAADPTISVKAQQRYPWNGLVDVAFTITGESGVKYDTSFVARDVAGGTNLVMKTIYKSDGSAAALTNTLAVGSYKWVWNAAADLPNGFVGDRMSVVGNLISEADKKRYMVVTLSNGAIQYLQEPPVSGWTDEYKTSQMVFRRVSAGTANLGIGKNVTISKDFYIGVFEVTQKQWYNVMKSTATGAFKGDMRPSGGVSYDALRGTSSGAKWPSSSSVDSGSFVYALRQKIGKSTVDLPTEAQWEYACRSGTATHYGNGTNYSNAEKDGNMAKVGRYAYNGGQISSVTSDTYTNPNKGSAIVGSYASNKWGLYDMHGNAWEWCLDSYNASADYSNTTDPKGPAADYYGRRVARGGCCAKNAAGCTSSVRRSFYSYDTAEDNNTLYPVGARIVVNL